VRGRRTRPLAASLTCAVLVVACASGPDVASPPLDTDVPDAPTEDVDRGTLRVALEVDPVSIDPRGVVDDEGELVVRALFEPLVVLDDRGAVLPGAAQRWEVSDDGRTYVFHLREATFQDGTPVTAEDFRRAFVRVADDDAAPRFRSGLLEGVVGLADASIEAGLAGVEVIDARTLRVRLDGERPAFLVNVSDLALVPVPASADRDPAAYEERPIGNGPFAMVEPRVRGGFVRLGRVADHHRAPLVDGVVLQVYADDPTGERRWADLLAGQVQVAPVTPDRREEALATFGIADDARRGPGVLLGAIASTYVYGFNVDRAPYDDVRLRQALSASIDRDVLASRVLEGTYLPAERIVPPALDLGTGEVPVCPHCTRDVELARSLYGSWLEDQPEGTSLTVTLDYPRSALHAAVAEALARDIEDALGVAVRLQARPLAGFVRAVEAGEAGLFRMGLRAGFPGPRGVADLLDPRFRPGGPDDWTRFGDADFGAELAALSADPDGAGERAVLLEERLLDRAAVIPLLWGRLDLVVTPEVRGFRVGPDGRWWLERVSLVRD